MGDRTHKSHELSFLTQLSGLAILMVVWIHLRNDYYAHTYPAGPEGFAAFTSLSTPDQLIELLIRYAVPIFVFVAAFKFEVNLPHHLVAGRFDWRGYFRARLRNLGLPYLLWSLIYLAAGFAQNRAEQALGVGTQTQLLSREHLLGILTGYGNYAYQLWFIPLLLFVTLAAVTVKYALKAPWVLYAVYALFFGTRLFVPDFATRIYPFGLWLPYFVPFEAGLYWGREFCRHGRLPGGAYAVGGWALAAGLRLVNRDPLADVWIDTLLMALTPAALCFLLAGLRQPALASGLSWLGRYSWPIYLLHAPVLANLTNSLSGRLGLTAVWLDLPKMALLVAASYLLYRVILRLPFLLKRVLF